MMILLKIAIAMKGAMLIDLCGFLVFACHRSRISEGMRRRGWIVGEIHANMMYFA